MTGFYGNEGGKYGKVATAKRAYEAYLKKHPNSTMSFARFKKSNMRQGPLKSRKGPKKGTAAKRARFEEFANRPGRFVYTKTYMRKLFNAAEKSLKEAQKALKKAERANKKKK